MKKTCIAIVGKSGSGKTWLANKLEESGVKTLVSYTTRPMRDGETNGVEHHFVSEEIFDELAAKDTMLAYTKFGDYRYCTFASQIHYASTVFSYVIDEDGLRYLKDRVGHLINVVSALVIRERRDDIDTQRRDRDKDRFNMGENEYDFVIVNDGSLDDLAKKGVKMLDCIRGIQTK